jgi:hypothetical protein
MDSGYYGAGACRAVGRVGACFSVTARMDPAVKAAIAGIAGDAWTPIRYPQAGLGRPAALLGVRR